MGRPSVRTACAPTPTSRSRSSSTRSSRLRNWRPQFLDYLYVGFTTANAFSPTDTMPMTHWAKVAMGSQALISFVVIGLILARAVNAFT